MSVAASFLDEIMAKGVGAIVPIPVKAKVNRRGQPAVDFPATPAGRKRARAQMARKGRERQVAVRKHFEAQGYRVETAYGKVYWIPMADGKRRPIVKRHDFFGLWDLMVVGNGQRFLIQVGSLGDVSTKRRAILDAGFPATAEDCIMGHEGGRVYRVLRGPLFETGQERIEVTKA